MEYFINHFSHPKHSLKLYRGNSRPWNSLGCFICQLNDQSVHPTRPIYGCRECQFKIHLDCAQLSQELTHPFHPQHSISMYYIGSKEMNYYIPCNACGFSIDRVSYVYSCAECKFMFNLHIHCMKLQPINDDQLKHQNISHEHHVFVCNQPTEFEFHCTFCQSRFSKTDLIFVCLDCKHLLHESCVFPLEIMHPFHPEHPLLLERYPSDDWDNRARCSACSQRGFSYFTCSQCKFFLDLSCISLRPTCRNSEYDQVLQNQPLKHPHPLIQCDPIKDQRLCSGCNSPIKDSIYVCLVCKVLLDKSCTQLLPEITSPFHPIHPLTLRSSEFEYDFCKMCHLFSPLLKYVCRECKFQMDTRCATSEKPYAIVKLRIHRHPLAFLIKEPEDVWNCKCVVCQIQCKKYFFNCHECDYCIHLECVPSLPLVIKHDCHCDPLIFIDSRIKDASDEDSDEEFYCHACEELRDLDDPIYYCKECHFVAHLHCVFPAILHGLESEPTASPTSSYAYQVSSNISIFRNL